MMPLACLGLTYPYCFYNYSFYRYIRPLHPSKKIRRYAHDQKGWINFQRCKFSRYIRFLRHRKELTISFPFAGEQTKLPKGNLFVQYRVILFYQHISDLSIDFEYLRHITCNNPYFILFFSSMVDISTSFLKFHNFRKLESPVKGGTSNIKYVIKYGCYD